MEEDMDEGQTQKGKKVNLCMFWWIHLCMFAFVSVSSVFAETTAQM